MLSTELECIRISEEARGICFGTLGGTRALFAPSTVEALLMFFCPERTGASCLAGDFVAILRESMMTPSP